MCMYKCPHLFYYDTIKKIESDKTKLNIMEFVQHYYRQFLSSGLLSTK